MGHQGVSHFENVIFDLIIAGTETTSTILTLAMRDMTLRPDIQAKVKLFRKLVETTCPLLIELIQVNIGTILRKSRSIFILQLLYIKCCVVLYKCKIVDTF